MAKTRPHLILSPEDEMGIITAIPITSKLSYIGEHDITYRGLDGTQEQLRMSQIVSIEKRNLLKYMYAIPNSLMRDVEMNIISRLQFNECGETVDKCEENHIPPLTTKTNDKESEPKIENKIKKEKTGSQVSGLMNPSISIYPIRNKNDRWTTSMMHQFLNDWMMFSKDELVIKYSISRNQIGERYKYIYARVHNS